MSTDTYTKDKRAVTGWVSGIAAVLITASISFLGSKIFAHETSIAVIQDKQQAAERRLDRIESKLDQILDRLPSK